MHRSGKEDRRDSLLCADSEQQSTPNKTITEWAIMNTTPHLSIFEKRSVMTITEIYGKYKKKALLPLADYTVVAMPNSWRFHYSIQWFNSDWFFKPKLWGLFNCFRFPLLPHTKKNVEDKKWIWFVGLTTEKEP